MTLEEGYAALKIPSWKDPAFAGHLPALDERRVARGKTLFAENCARCHASRAEGPFTEPNPFGRRFVTVPNVPAAEIGTDKLFLDRFFGSRMKLPDYYVNLPGSWNIGPDGTVMGQDIRVRMITDLVQGYFQQNGIAPNTPEFFRTIAFRANKSRTAEELNGYRAAPLEGIAFSAPYLHNGSVRTLQQLLLPPEEREKTFQAGGRDFDPIAVGYVTRPQTPNAFKYDTRIPGNSNAGHTYGTALPAPDKKALLEYLKSI